MERRTYLSFTILFIIFNFGISSISFSQDSNDSLFKGRECKIILYNGIESIGKITRSTTDSITIKTGIDESSLARNEIKYVLSPNEDENVRVGFLGLFKGRDNSLPVASEECDVYLQDRSVLKDVNLISVNDTSLYAYKELAKREILYSDIRKIVFKPAAPFWKGYLIGAGIGFTVIFLPVALSKGGGHPDFSGPGIGAIFGIIASIPAGLLGGVIGAIAAHDDVYNFEAGYSHSKVKRINHIIKKNPI